MAIPGIPTSLLTMGPTSGLVTRGGTAAASAGGSGLMGMLGGPLGMAAMSFLPGLVSSLFGDPAEAQRRKIMQMISPQAIEAAKQRHLAEIMNSQEFHMANRMNMIGGQAAQNSMSSNLAQRGLSGSGIGAIAPGLAGMAITNQRGNLYAQAGRDAYQAGREEQYGKAGLGMQMMPQGPSMTRGLFAGGMNAFGPWMGRYMQNRNGGGWA